MYAFEISRLQFDTKFNKNNLKNQIDSIIFGTYSRRGYIC